MSKGISFSAEDYEGMRCQVFTARGFSIPSKVKVITEDSRTLTFPKTKMQMQTLKELALGEAKMKSALEELCVETFELLKAEDARGNLKPLYLFSVDTFYDWLKNAH